MNTHDAKVKPNKKPEDQSTNVKNMLYQSYSLGSFVQSPDNNRSRSNLGFGSGSKYFRSIDLEADQYQ